jgi:hypothetical protein
MPQYSEAQLSLFVDQLLTRVDRLEKQLSALVAPSPGGDLVAPPARPGGALPPEVVALVQAGDRMGAISKYRQLVGGDVDAARAAISTL